MNKTFLIGRLTKDPETTYTQNSKAKTPNLIKICAGSFMLPKPPSPPFVRFIIATSSSSINRVRSDAPTAKTVPFIKFIMVLFVPALYCDNVCVSEVEKLSSRDKLHKSEIITSTKLKFQNTSLNGGKCKKCRRFLG